MNTGIRSCGSYTAVRGGGTHGRVTPLPKLTAHIENGDVYMAARTCGDGACALHSAWGVEQQNVADRGAWFYCDNARERLGLHTPANLLDSDLKNETTQAGKKALLRALMNDLNDEVSYRFASEDIFTPANQNKSRFTKLQGKKLVIRGWWFI